MATKLKALRQIVADLASVFPDLTPGQEIYLVPRIMAIPSMAPLEIQVCDGSSVYEDITGGCRSEDFVVLVGVFRKYRLDSGGRHAKALSDLHLSLLELKEAIVTILDGNFLTPLELLTRPLIVKTETEISETGSTGNGQLLKTIGFLAGLNVAMTGAEVIVPLGYIVREYESIIITDAVTIAIQNKVEDVSVYDSLDTTDAVALKLALNSLVFSSIDITEAVTLAIQNKAESVVVFSSLDIAEAVTLMISNKIESVTVFSSIDIAEAVTLAILNKAESVTVFSSINVADAVSIAIV